MPQDAFTLRLNALELHRSLTGGRVNKINQPAREEVSVLIYTGKRTVKLSLNANASDCGVYFSEEESENPLVAPNFCMLLRKYIQGALITGVETAGFERILAIRLHCVSDFQECERILYAEVMGKYSNLLLVEQGVILGALKTTAADEQCKRLILPGAKYVLPARQDKADPSDLTALRACLAGAEGDLAHFLFTRVAGLAPCTAEDIAKSFTGGDLAAHVHDYIFSDEISPCVTEKNGSVCDFFARMHAGARPFATLSEAQAYFYRKKRRKAALEGMRRRLLSAVAQAKKKQEKRLAQIAEKQRSAADAETVRLKGELLTANLYALSRGMTSCELVNYYDEEGRTVKIALDAQLTPSQNAQAYFRRYQKQREPHPHPHRGGGHGRPARRRGGAHGRRARQSPAGGAAEKGEGGDPLPHLSGGRFHRLCGAQQRAERPPCAHERTRRCVAARARAALRARRHPRAGEKGSPRRARLCGGRVREVLGGGRRQDPRGLLPREERQKAQGQQGGFHHLYGL